MATVGQLDVKIGVDLRSLRQGIQQAQRLVQQFSRQRIQPIRIGVDTRQAERQVNNFNRGLNRLSSQGRNININANVSSAMLQLQRLQAQMSTLGNTTINVNANAGQAQSAVDGLFSGVNKVQQVLGMIESGFDRIAQIGAKMTAGITAPVVATGASFTSKFVAYDDVQLELQGILQDGGEIEIGTDKAKKKLKELRDYALKMGLQSKYSPTDVSSSMLNLSKSGFGYDQIMKATPDLLNLATVAHMDLDSSSNYLAQALTQFQLDADETNRVVDTMSKAANMSTIEVPDIAEALSQAGPKMSQFNQTIETTNALIGLMGNNGIKGGRAGTGIKAMLRDMTDQSKGLAVLESKGIDVYDRKTGKMRNAIDILIDLKRYTEKMSQAERDAFLDSVFLEQGLTGVNAIISQSEEDIRGMEKAVNDSAGSAQKLADVMNSGLGGALRTLKSAIDTIAISFIQALEPTLKKVTELITKFAVKISNLPDGVKKAIAIFLGLLAVIGPVLLIVGLLGGAFFGMLSGILSLAIGIPIIIAIVAEFWEIILVVIAVGVAFVAFAGWVVFLVGYLVYLANNNDQVANYIKDIWKEWGTKIITFLKQTWQVIKDVFRVYLEYIKDWIVFILAVIAKDWEGAGKAWREVVRNTMVILVWTSRVALATLVNLYIEMAEKTINIWLELGTALINKAIELGEKIANTFVDWINAVLRKMWEFKSKLFDVWKKSGESTQGVLSTLVTNIGIAVGNIYGTAIDGFRQMGEAVGKILGNLARNAFDKLKSIWDGLQNLFKGKKPVEVKVKTSVMDGVSSSIKQHKDKAYKAIKDVWNSTTAPQLRHVNFDSYKMKAPKVNFDKYKMNVPTLDQLMRIIFPNENPDWLKNGKNPKKPGKEEDPKAPEMEKGTEKPYTPGQYRDDDGSDEETEYQKAVDRIADSIKNMTKSFSDAIGLFDRSVRKYVNKDILMARASERAKQYKEWSNIQSTLLNSSALSDNTKAKLGTMGTDKLAELRALASMTQDELRRWDYYNQVSESASQQTAVQATFNNEVYVNLNEANVDQLANAIMAKIKKRGK